MTALYDLHWSLIQDWIEEISIENISVAFRTEFSRIVNRLAKAHFYQNRGGIPRHKYQVYILACMYIVSCYTCHWMLTLKELRLWCDECYTADTIVEAIHVFVQWMHHQDGNFEVHDIETLQTCEASICDLVRCSADDRLLVRKRIYHREGLPAYDAMVEVVTHYLLNTTGTYTNVARLVHVQTSDTSVDLFYVYVLTPLVNLFGRTVGTCTQKIIQSLLQGVRCLHAIGIAHRDLKGANIHVTQENECMLLDLGAAGCREHRETVPVCTITHRSPDILQAEADDVDYVYNGHGLDMWSVGVLIAEIHLGPHPFGRVYQDMTPQRMLMRIDRMKDGVLMKLRETCTVTQVGMIHRCLQYLPADRPDINEVLSVFSV
jgi:serine/threonine protein kinase